MRSNQDIKNKIAEMKCELDALFIKRDATTKNWMFQEICLEICNLCEKIKLMEWVLNE